MNANKETNQQQCVGLQHRPDPTEASRCASILTLTISVNIKAISDHIIVGLKSK